MCRDESFACDLRASANLYAFPLRKSSDLSAIAMGYSAKLLDFEQIES